MKKRYVYLATALVAASFGIGGATFALFSAQAPASGDFVAGTLRLDGNRSGGDTVPGPMFYLNNDLGLKGTGLWAPGDSHKRYFQIENAGTLAARMTSISATMPNRSHLEFAGQLDVRVTDEFGLEVASGKLSDFMVTGGKAFDQLIELEPSDILTLTFEVSLPLETNNDFQGLTADEVSFEVSAVQVKNNP